MTWLAILRVAAIASVASACVAGWSVMRAVRADDPIPVAQAGVLDPGRRTSRPKPPRVNITAAVSADPFNPARQAPASPYRLPGEADPIAPTPTGPRAPQLRVLGTVVFTSGGGFATCQVGNERPMIVRVGEKIGNYTLKRVARGSAVFTGPTGDSVTVAAPQPGR